MISSIQPAPVSLGHDQTLHLVGADTPPHRAELLDDWLRTRGNRDTVWHVGSGQAIIAPASRARQGLLGGGGALCNWLERAGPNRVHVWSQQASDLLVAALLVDVRLGRVLSRFCVYLDGESIDPQRSARLLEWCEHANYACQRVLDAGTGAAHGAVLKQCAPRLGTTAEARGRARSKIRIAPEHWLVTILPPLTRAAFVFEGVWATILLQKMKPNVRLLLPGGGREVQRAERLLRSCRRNFMKRRNTRLTLAEQVSAADVALALHPDPRDSRGVCTAAGAGVPLVLAHQRRGLFEDSAHALHADPQAPQSIATQLVELHENPQRGRALAASASDAVDQLLYDRYPPFDAIYSARPNHPNAPE